MNTNGSKRLAIVLNRRKKIILVRYGSNKSTGNRHFPLEGTRLWGRGANQDGLDAQPVLPGLKETAQFIRSNTGPLINNQGNTRFAVSIRLTDMAKIKQKAHEYMHTTFTLADSSFRPALVVS